jgi:hypothetical protein
MPKQRLIALAAALTALLLVPGPATAKRKRSLLWATVNICDTKRHPDMMGVRARMPGNGTRQRMYMRFTAQFRDEARWKRVNGGRSVWIYVGRAGLRFRDAGFTFQLTTPSPGASYVVRGVVHFQWRRKRRHRKGWKVVRRARRVTTAGHPGSLGADPKGFSAARCRIETPPAEGG